MIAQPDKSLWGRQYLQTIAWVRDYCRNAHFNYLLKFICDTFAGLQICIDGIPAFSRKTKSMKPLDAVNFSLPPALRVLPRYILLMALVPDDIPQAGQKKYFDFAARYELNDLFHTGSHIFVVLCMQHA